MGRQGVAEEGEVGSGRVGFCVKGQIPGSYGGIYGVVKRRGREWSIVTSLALSISDYILGREC